LLSPRLLPLLGRLSRKQCCWAEDATDLNHACSLWHEWGHGQGVGYASAYFAYIAFALLFAWMCAVLVKKLAPYAAGSGIPEVRPVLRNCTDTATCSHCICAVQVKTILSGFIIRGYFDGWTLLVKATGAFLSQSPVPMGSSV